MHKCKIEWADCVWNPITGCQNNCEYCIARKQSLQQCGDRRLNMATAKKWNGTDIFHLEKPFGARNGHFLSFPYGYAPTFHEYRMDNLSTRKTGAKILVGSMGEMFGDWIPDELLEMVFAECEKYPQHTYFFLTKNPARYLRLAQDGKLPKRDNMWYGTTVPTGDTEFFFAYEYKTYINIEPMLGDFPFPQDLRVDWVIVGAEIKARKNPVVPKKEWVTSLIQACDSHGVPLFMRNNLADLMGNDFMQVFPDILTVKPELTIRQKKLLVDVCGFCKREMPKKEMHTITVRKGKYGQNKTIGFLCDGCIEELRKKME